MNEYFHDLNDKNSSNVETKHLQAYELQSNNQPIKAINALIDKLKVYGMPFSPQVNRKLKLGTERLPAVITLITGGVSDFITKLLTDRSRLRLHQPLLEYMNCVKVIT